MNVELTSTVEDFIKAGSNVIISYDKFSLLSKTDNGNIIPVYNIINDYISELRSIAPTVELTDLDLSRYIYKPKLLCADVYGGASEELYFIILAINNMCSVKEFTSKKIKMLRKADISTVLTYIYNAQKGYIDNNRYKINEV